MPPSAPLLLSDEDRETLRRNVKNNNIPLEYTKGRGAQVLDRILFEQGLGKRIKTIQLLDYCIDHTWTMIPILGRKPGLYLILRHVRQDQRPV